MILATLPDQPPYNTRTPGSRAERFRLEVAMSTTYPALAQFVSMPGWGELLIIAFIGLLLFGKRLPEVGRSLGKGIVEFKKGLRGVEDEIEDAVNRPSSDRALPRNNDTYQAPATHEEPAAEKTHAPPGP
jgi:sec-independent protein translocase protein TatA